MTMTTPRDDPDAMTEGLTTTRARAREDAGGSSAGGARLRRGVRERWIRRGGEWWIRSVEVCVERERDERGEGR
jgi:hypothetical protein